MTSGYDEAYRAFQQAFAGYSGGSRLDQLRATDYERLDRLGHVYLDYTGGSLHAASQLQRHADVLQNTVLGNPHSNNPTSLDASRRVDRARASVLSFFNADPAQYDVIFTPNATGALKLVGEAYPFEAGGRLLLTYDNHNSVNGLREFARRRGARVTYLPVLTPELRVDGDAVLAELGQARSGGARLFAFPAQSNFSGVQHPLAWIERAQQAGWQVVLDAAAYVPTNRFDLSTMHPDFVSVSFYKMFGYPAGLGALVARHDALGTLRRPWFAGGTITVASVQDERWHHLASGHAGFEDGTVDYLGLPAVEIGLDHLSSIGIDAIHDRVMALTGWLLARLTSATHSNGAPMARVFGPSGLERRGGTVAFHLMAPDGTPYDVGAVEERASASRISLRTGCFCNPGDGEVAHGISKDAMAQCFAGPSVPVSFLDCAETLRASIGRAPNTLRASLGIASNFADVHTFMAFVDRFRDLPGEIGSILPR